MSLVQKAGNPGYGQVLPFEQKPASTKFGGAAAPDLRFVHLLASEHPVPGQSPNSTQMTITRLHGDFLNMVLGAGTLDKLLDPQKPVSERATHLNQLVQSLKSTSLLAKHHNVDLPNLSKSTIFIPEPGEGLCTNDTQVAILRLHKRIIDLLKAQDYATIGSKPISTPEEKLNTLHQLSEALRDISNLADFHEISLIYDGTNASVTRQLDTKA